MNYKTDTLWNDKITLLIIATIIGFFLFLLIFINIYLPFKDERDYIKMEMERSDDEEEYLYWQRELKMLYMSKIPIVHFIAQNKYKR